MDRAIARDPGYCVPLSAAVLLLMQAIAALGVAYFLRFRNTRRQSGTLLLLHVVVGLLTIRALVLLSEHYVSIN
jgi:hypothetical protein